MWTNLGQTFFFPFTSMHTRVTSNGPSPMTNKNKCGENYGQTIPLAFDLWHLLILLYEQAGHLQCH